MLRARLFLNLLPFVAILAGTGIYAIALFSRLANSVDKAITENYRSILAAQDLSLALAGMEREAWALAASSNASNRAFAGYQARFEKDLAAQLKSVSLAGEKDLNRQLALQYDAFKLALQRLLSAPTPAAQRQVYEREILPDVLRLNSVVEKIREFNHHAILATGQRVQKVTGDVTRLMVGGMVVALALSAYAGFQASRLLVRPIQALTRAARELGEGQPGQPVPVASRDELGELASAFNKMAAQLQEYRHSTTERIVRLHRTMETTLASFPDPIFVLSKDGRTELKNPAAAELAVALRLDTELPDRMQAIAATALDTGENFVPHSFNEAVLCRVNGADKFFLPRALVMRDKEEALFGVALVLQDVTRFRLLDAAKTNLVATVSHELKTPLTGVRMALHLLLERTVGALTPKQDELLEAARQDTERLLRILNDLLDLTRLEEGNAELHREPTPPAELLSELVSEMDDQAAAKGLKMDCRAAPNLPAVSVDRQLIRYVFTNLLTNAIKHSPPGGQIRLQAERVGDESVQFSVTDEGAGVPEEYQARVFDRFFRVPGQTKTGAGLGLSIAREITVAHGGRIGVRSVSGQGSTFYVVLEAVNGRPG